jgi:hypothetical protein
MFLHKNMFKYLIKYILHTVFYITEYRIYISSRSFPETLTKSFYLNFQIPVPFSPIRPWKLINSDWDNAFTTKPQLSGLHKP